jgi:hypothetical protein
MGASGLDVILSPAARKVFGDHAWECKNVEKLNVPTVFLEHEAKYPGKVSFLAHKRNHTPILCTMRLETLLELLSLQIKEKCS